jgi:serine/threonine-protein kinase
VEGGDTFDHSSRAEPQATIGSGTVFAGYRIESEIGRGGMGVVYRARHLALDREYALKLISPALSNDPRFRERFQRESRLAASLEHPNLVKVDHAGDEGGSLYLAMRLVEGSDLRRIVEAEGPLDLSRGAEVLGGVAAGLDAAHARGLIHRDVKPANVLVTDDGRPVLGDFGVAHVLEGAGDLTEAGTVIGTPHYMAPEQAAGQTPGPECDIYALGVMLFQMLTGRLPFNGATPVAVALAHLRQEPPAARSINPELSEAVESILQRALAKRPADRYPSGAALIEALSTTAWQAVPVRAAEPKPVERRGSSRWSLALAALLLVAGAGSAAWYGSSPSTLTSLLGRISQPGPTATDPPSKPAPSTPVAARPGTLLRADDFANPAQGLFRDGQQGDSQLKLADGRGADYRWQYGYQDHSLALKLPGPYPDPANQALLGVGALAADRLNTDFAVEVTANVTKSPSVALYGLRYSLGPGDSYFFRIGRDGASFDLWSEQGPTSLGGGRTTTIQRGQPNTLRLEIYGDTLRAFANGQLLGTAQHPGLTRRGGQLALLVEMAGPPPDGEVEVRFSDLKLYTLTP